MNQAQRAAQLIEDEGVAAFFDATDFTSGCSIVYNHHEAGGPGNHLPIVFEDASVLTLVVHSWTWREGGPMPLGWNASGSHHPAAKPCGAVGPLRLGACVAPHGHLTLHENELGQTWLDGAEAAEPRQP